MLLGHIHRRFDGKSFCCVYRYGKDAMSWVGVMPVRTVHLGVRTATSDPSGDQSLWLFPIERLIGIDACTVGRHPSHMPADDCRTHLGRGGINARERSKTPETADGPSAEASVGACCAESVPLSRFRADGIDPRLLRGIVLLGCGSLIAG
jgi:hypothetical protein